MVESITQTTEQIAPRERWDFWKDTALVAVDAAPAGDTAAFEAHRTLSHTPFGTLIETRSEPLSMRRPRSKIARDGIDHACLVLPLKGSGVIDQLSRPEDVLQPGDLFLYDLGRPYTAASVEPYHELRLYVPRDVFAARIGRIEKISGLRLRRGDGLSSLFASYLAGYAAALPSLSERDAATGMDGVIHLLSGLVATAVNASNDDGTTLVGDTLHALAARHIEVLLGDPKLDVAMLARAIGASRSRLYDAFAAQGGVATAIREARLDRAMLRLRTSTHHRHTLEEIARLCGFPEYPTFTRAFRRRFGISPTAARADAACASPSHRDATAQGVPSKKR